MRYFYQLILILLTNSLLLYSQSLSKIQKKINGIKVNIDNRKNDIITQYSYTIKNYKITIILNNNIIENIIVTNNNNKINITSNNIHKNLKTIFNMNLEPNINNKPNQLSLGKIGKKNIPKVLLNISLTGDSLFYLYPKSLYFNYHNSQCLKSKKSKEELQKNFMINIINYYKQIDPKHPILQKKFKHLYIIIQAYDEFNPTAIHKNFYVLKMNSCFPCPGIDREIISKPYNVINNYNNYLANLKEFTINDISQKNSYFTKTFPINSWYLVDSTASHISSNYFSSSDRHVHPFIILFQQYIESVYKRSYGYITIKPSLSDGDKMFFLCQHPMHIILMKQFAYANCASNVLKNIISFALMIQESTTGCTTEDDCWKKCIKNISINKDDLVYLNVENINCNTIDDLKDPQFLKSPLMSDLLLRIQYRLSYFYFFEKRQLSPHIGDEGLVLATYITINKDVYLVLYDTKDINKTLYISGPNKKQHYKEINDFFYGIYHHKNMLSYTNNIVYLKKCHNKLNDLINLMKINCLRPRIFAPFLPLNLRKQYENSTSHGIYIVIKNKNKIFFQNDIEEVFFHSLMILSRSDKEKSFIENFLNDFSNLFK